MVHGHRTTHRPSLGWPVVTPSGALLCRMGGGGGYATLRRVRKTRKSGALPGDPRRGRGGRRAYPPCDGYASIPAIEAEVKAARFPATIARSPSEAMSRFRSGANPPIPPIWIAIEEKFAKPRSA